ncbi:ATP-binding protein [Motiliproteus sp. MSK22-1]|uniref:ATP-binding protein n=1 Tax=Motiliproteus sp. MSK22-1 TaxID=1897630 RepID=UPI000978A009|nr:ATP-binding protein [Motiliproteus sp. MSK22-1]OMH38837.1 hypothetical protein BGP75_00205 [Motiliproteus sp. MSK22-1]
MNQGFETAVFKAARSAAIETLADCNGFVLIEGASGTGKTLLKKQLEDKLQTRYTLVSLSYCRFDVEELLNTIADKLELSQSPAHSPATANDSCLDAVREYAQEKERTGSPLALLIDDAQYIPEETLTSLANAISGDTPLLPIRGVLFASPGFHRQLLQKHIDRTLLSQHLLLSPPTEDELKSYVKGLVAQESKGNLSIKESALQSLLFNAAGSFRSAQKLVKLAVIETTISGQNQINEEIVDQVHSENSFGQLNADQWPAQEKQFQPSETEGTSSHQGDTLGGLLTASLLDTPKVPQLKKRSDRLDTPLFVNDLAAPKVEIDSVLEPSDPVEPEKNPEEQPTSSTNRTDKAESRAKTTVESNSAPKSAVIKKLKPTLKNAESPSKSPAISAKKQPQQHPDTLTQPITEKVTPLPQADQSSGNRRANDKQNRPTPISSESKLSVKESLGKESAVKQQSLSQQSPATKEYPEANNATENAPLAVSPTPVSSAQNKSQGTTKSGADVLEFSPGTSRPELHPIKSITDFDEKKKRSIALPMVAILVIVAGGAGYLHLSKNPDFDPKQLAAQTQQQVTEFISEMQLKIQSLIDDQPPSQAITVAKAPTEPAATKPLPAQESSQPATDTDSIRNSATTAQIDEKSPPTGTSPIPSEPTNSQSQEPVATVEAPAIPQQPVVLEDKTAAAISDITTNRDTTTNTDVAINTNAVTNTDSSLSKTVSSSPISETTMSQSTEPEPNGSEPTTATSAEISQKEPLSENISRQIPNIENSAPVGPVTLSEENSVDNRNQDASEIPTPDSNIEKTALTAEIEARQAQIKLLLKKAEIHQKAYRLTIPENDNAVLTYRRILELDPQNTVALNGIKDIAQRYQARAERAMEEQNWGIAAQNYSRLLWMSPDNERAQAGVARLKQELSN